MGARHVGWLIANGAGLSENAFRIGVFIALHARDMPSKSKAADEYTLGARAACEILFPNIPFNAARQRYTRGIRELKAAGLVDSTSGYGGRAAGRMATVRIHPNGTA